MMKSASTESEIQELLTLAVQHEQNEDWTAVKQSLRQAQVNNNFYFFL